MDQAFALATRWIREWARRHPTSFPPIVINITDGAPNQDEPTVQAAAELVQVATSDGNALLLNAHVSANSAESIALPSTPDALPTAFARLLFDMSSQLPEPMKTSAAQQRFEVTDGARGFIFNADPQSLVRLLTFGSLPATQR